MGMHFRHPARAEKDAWNAVESHRLAKGTKDVVETTFQFRPGSFDAPLETMRPTGYVSAGDPAVWVMARTRTLPDANWARLEGIVKEAGYDLATLRRVPQRWGQAPDVSPAERELAAK